MKLTILGSGGSSLSAKRSCASFVIDESILLDLGPGAFKNLRISGIPLEKVSRVFISHWHADHISDLFPFLWATQIDGRRTPLELYGPRGFRDIFRKLNECTATSKGFFTFPLTVSELDFGQRLDDDVSTCRTDHSIPTLAFRFDVAGKSFCYSADTIYCPDVVKLGHGVDLLVHEATFLDDQLDIAKLTYHSTARMAGRAGREAGARKLVLFHIPPPNESREDEFRRDAMAEYDADVTVATDLATITI